MSTHRPSTHMRTPSHSVLAAQLAPALAPDACASSGIALMTPRIASVIPHVALRACSIRRPPPAFHRRGFPAEHKAAPNGTSRRERYRSTIVHGVSKKMYKGGTKMVGGLIVRRRSWRGAQWRTERTRALSKCAKLPVACVVGDRGIVRALGALLITGSLMACGGRSGLVTSGSYDGGMGSGTGSASAKVDSGSSTREAGTDARTEGGLSCQPAFLEAGTGFAGDAEVPIYHRAMPSCCPSERGPAPGTQPYATGMANSCSSDSQCTRGADGRCFPFEGLVGPGGCSYDQCFTDSDCPSGALCVCRTSASDNSANACAPGGNCALDSDCGSGGYCSPSGGCGFGFTGAQGYYCHTVSDTCINDADCPVVDPGGGCQVPQNCAYDAQAQHWACIQQACCPP